MSKWDVFNFEKVILDDTKNGTKIKKENYLEQGLHPVIDQSQHQIAGYRNTGDGLYNNIPAIIFGDHTRVIKYIDTPFFLGADGVKLLKSKKDNVSYKYLYYFFIKNKVANTGYNRHFKWLKELVIPLPPLEAQKKIAKTLDTAAELLSMRKQQLSELDNLIKSTFYNMFGDPLTNFRSFSTIRLENFIEFMTSGSRGWAQYYVPNGEKFITIKNVKNGRLDFSELTFVKAPKNKESLRTRVEKDDLLISITADLGRTAVVDEVTASIY